MPSIAEILNPPTVKKRGRPSDASLRLLKILAFHQREVEAKPVREIARTLGRSTSLVHRWIREAATYPECAPLVAC
jgi:DNA-binding transcriptional regulator YiaG